MRNLLHVGLLFFIFSVLLFSCDEVENEAKFKKPNIVIVLTDDMGFGDTGLNGNTKVQTPNIDQLGTGGKIFDRFYVTPVCSPTRAELLTGRYHVRGGVYSTSQGGERLDLDEITIADIFKVNGYKTAIYGKWHNGTQYPYHPNGRGFDAFYGFTSGHWGSYFDPVLDRNGEMVKGNGFLPDDLTTNALNFIEENNDTPFLLILSFNTPHSPMQVPDNWWAKHEDTEIQEHRFSHRENNEHTKAVYALTENIDWNVGRLNQTLEKLELKDETILVFLSDNGPNGWRFNNGLKGIKGSTDEGGVRAPFSIIWPNHIEPGTQSSEIAGAIDLLPTLADLAGINLDQSNRLDGISLKPLIFDQEEEWSDRYLVSYWKNRISLRNKRFMLDENDMLFDIINDPGQTTDIADQFPDEVERMTSYRKSWKEEVLWELPEQDDRMIPVGHKGSKITQLPARDAAVTGSIKRSNRWPNDSFFTAWTNTDSYLSWDIELLEAGNYEAILYYTCKESDLGSTVALEFQGASLTQKITTAHDPPLAGHEKDRVLREESYVKDFRPMSMGSTYLNKGQGVLKLKATTLAHEHVMDFKLLLLKRIPN